MANTGNTQQQINYGAAANDGQGDPLRTAFIKTDDNFDAIWNTGPVGSNITILNNTIRANDVNGNIVLRPNGVGVIQSNASIVPNTANLRDLGSAGQRWRAAYIGSGGLSVDGNVTVTGNLTAGNISYTGNVFVGDLQGSVYADDSTIMVDAVDNAMFADSATFALANITGNVTANYFIGNGSQLTGITSSYGNANVVANLAALGNNFISTTGNVTANYFVGNGSLLTGITSYANANVLALGEAGWSGNIIPSANAVYSLGNATNYWSNLWVANNTIYIGGVPLGITAGNVLTVDGEAVLSNDSDATITTTGNITANYFIGDGSQLANLSTAPGNLIENGDSNVTIASPNGNITVNADTETWTFDTTGNLIFPSNGQIVMDGSDGTIGNQSDDFVISWDNEEIRVVSVGGSIEMQADAAFRVQTNYDGANVLYASRWEFSNNELVNITNDFGIVSEAGNLTLSGGRDGVNSGNTIISAVDLGSAVFNWTFGNDGGLYIPNNGALVGVTANNNGYINWVGNSSGDGNGFTTMQLVPDGTVDSQILVLDPTDPGHIHLRAPGISGNIEQPAANIFLGPENTNFEITAQYIDPAEARIHSAGNTWTFANNGDLNLPSEGNIVGMTPNNAGRLQWVGNSSGDGNGYTTIQMVPDETVFGNDQYLIIDPTGGSPGHIHIRAGGTQDNSSADLFLGGENSYVKLPAGPDPNVQIAANTLVWTFGSAGAYGELTLPAGEGAIRTIDDTLSLVSFNTTTGNANSVYLGSSGGLGFYDQEIGGNWLEIFRSGAEPEIRVPVGRGNLNIQTAEGANVYNWTFDNTGNLTVPGNISTSGNILAGNVLANVAGFAIGYRDIPQVAFTGNATIAAADAGKHFYSTESTDYVLTIANNTSVSWSVGTAITVVNRGSGNITVAQASGVSLYLAGNNTAGNRTVSTYGMATVLNVAANVWMINGTGVA